MLRSTIVPVFPVLVWLVGTSVAWGADAPGFHAEYQRTRNPEFKVWQQGFKEERVLETVAEELNATIRVPSPIILSLEECGEPNAFYHSDGQRVVLCYELAVHLMELFEDRHEDEQADLVAGTLVFFMGHEIGHALTHVLDLPITGKEEDAVDQLATWMLSDGSPDSEAALAAAAETFALWSDSAEADESAFADEHSLDSQRLYNILCWSYGRDPEGYADLVSDGVLPEARAEGCAGEFERIDRSWSRLLEEHLVEKSR